ncbi:hypothetical protein ACMUMQ_02830 [Marinomonas sp. 2405UD66-6]|uniref:capsular polysaccharide export protein, LipB/KpsS family n=1 Tax=Marinomonas sp. 2405UD66-6 TaxID=3391834 RepID=UPI0039C92AC3
MDYLFISRKNLHAKYYRRLTEKLGEGYNLHVMGMPKLQALMHLKEAYRKDFSKVIQNQIKRKKAQSKVWELFLIEAIYAKAMTFYEKLRFAKYLALFNEEKPENIVVWNGKKLPNITAVMAAEHLKVNVFYFENGLLPGTTTLDPQGVNAASSLSQDPKFYLNFDPKNTLSFTLPTLTQRANHKKRNEFGNKDLPDNFLFVAFQVPHDTQIASHSPWITSMEMLYEEVMKAVEALDLSLTVVFKEHPTWPKHYDSLYNKSDKAIFANGNQTPELIEKAKAVITINSTVGLEALLLNKQVITLGDACYNIDGLVQNAKNANELIESLKNIEQGWKANSALRDKFFTYLKHIYCIPGSRKSADKEHIEAVKNRLHHTDSFSLSLEKEH